MGKYFFLLYLLFNSLIAIGQTTFHPTKQYLKISSKARWLYEEKDFIKSGLTYDSLFKKYKNIGYKKDKYNAACVWAMAGNNDKAFFYLEQAVIIDEWVNVPNILSETDLDTLHTDKRWQPLINKVMLRNKAPENKLNKPLVSLLATIDIIDQTDRENFDPILNKYGMPSKEMDSLMEKIRVQDSSNLTQVTYIIDSLGWLGPSEIGEDGASTIFLVIQHADLATQIKYLPIMRAAVKKGKARPQDLALLEDRVLTDQGKKQIYGSQVRIDSIGQKSFYPIIDEANVNNRRASVGLGPIEDYAKYFGLTYVIPKKKKTTVH